MKGMSSGLPVALYTRAEVPKLGDFVCLVSPDVSIV